MSIWPLLPNPRRSFVVGSAGEKGEVDEEVEAGDVAQDELRGHVEFTAEGTPVEPRVLRLHRYTTTFVTTHKSAAVSASFSPDGRYVATGSVDTSIKLLDVPKMLQQTRDKGKPGAHDIERPVRTFYDHTGPVVGIAFHPTHQLFASCGRDSCVKLFDFSKSMARRSFRSLADSHPGRACVFHPSGEHLLVATDHPEPRLIDIKTLQFFIMPTPVHCLYAPLSDIAVAPEGRVFATSSSDGVIRIFDVVSNELVSEIREDVPINSVRFSRNGQYCLYSTRDFSSHLVNWSTKKKLRTYERTMGKATFSYNESFVLSTDETGTTILVHNTRSGDLVQQLPSGHSAMIHGLASSPVEPAFLSCSEDHRARFWVGAT